MAVRTGSKVARLQAMPRTTIEPRTWTTPAPTYDDVRGYRAMHPAPSIRVRGLDRPTAELVPYDPEREHVTTSHRAKQVLLLASEVVLDQVSPLERDPAAVVERLIRARVLPACYRRRYDERFLEVFHNVIEQTRNALVSDVPFLANTASELAAHAVFREACGVLAGPGEEALDRAAYIDASLPQQLAVNGAHLADEVDLLSAAIVDDADVLLLFDIPPGEDPEEHLTPPDGPSGWSLLRFENWLVPFGGAPRPHITYDGRAWPTEL